MSSEQMETESSASAVLDKKLKTSANKPPPQLETVRGHTFQVTVMNIELKGYRAYNYNFFKYYKTLFESYYIHRWGQDIMV